MSPEMEVVNMEITKEVLLPISQTEVSAGESLAPQLPGIDDNELFQIIMTH